MAKNIYAVAWTWRNHKIVKTKKEGAELIREWRERYKAEGWKTQPFYTGYLATNTQGERHVVTFQEYDPETRERLV